MSGLPTLLVNHRVTAIFEVSGVPFCLPRMPPKTADFAASNSPSFIDKINLPMPIKFIINTFGSAGDVHPFIALGRQLRERGHDVVYITSAKFKPLIEREGIRCRALGTVEHYDAMIRDPRLWDPRVALGVILEGIAASFPNSVAAIREEVAGHDGKCCVVGSSLSFAARAVSQRDGLAMASIHLAPTMFWSSEAPPLFAPEAAFLQRAPRGIRPWLFWLIDKLIHWRFARPLNREYRRMGLPAPSRPFGRDIHSPELVVGMFPEWFAPAQRDWPSPLLLPGFPLFAESGAAEEGLPGELSTFLKAGEPPVVFAPGSANVQGHHFFAEAAKACCELGVGGVFVTPARETIPMPLSPTIHHVEYVDFPRLFPHCAAVVHHGGIGTLAQALAAGKPHLVMPMAHDQFDNAERLARLGVAEVLEARRWSAPAVVERLGALLSGKEHARKALELAPKVRKGADWAALCQRLETLAR